MLHRAVYRVEHEKPRANKVHEPTAAASPAAGTFAMLANPRSDREAFSRYLTAEFVSSTLFLRFELTGSAAIRTARKWELRNDAVG